MSDYYVILTGSKNNAGDYLIKHRAKKLFAELRPDRDIVDMNAWEPFDKEKLEVVNNSKALILMGGPALQKNMYPGIYKLTDNLDDIEVPIVLMGVGWKSPKGEWVNTYKYPLTDSSKKLLNRIKYDGLKSSVRDFHTLNTLAFHGVKDVLMTGCPAYYDLESINKPFEFPTEIKKVAFSLGVAFIRSASMEKQIKSQIIRLKERFKDAKFEVVFHHSLNQDVLVSSGSADSYHNVRHTQLANWLKSREIHFVDISGSAENLINYYTDVDLHIGYRVHAHIFMNSLKKLSLLLSEDGRAKGSRSVINGMVIDGYHDVRENIFLKIFNRLKLGVDRYKSNTEALPDMINMLDYEFMTKGHRSNTSSSLIRVNFEYMKAFLSQLP